MQTITLQTLLEAGCHFGHKSERWHPRASEYIYAEKDGIHIIDLAKTKAGLEAAMTFVRDTVANGGEVLFVGTKRQAKDIVKEEALKVGAPFFAQRWIGGFLTNWEEIKKNVSKVNQMMKDQQEGNWKKYPKHEQMQLARQLDRLNDYYEGVLTTKRIPDVLFVIDVKKEIAAVREAIRCGSTVVAIVDTNSDPKGVNFVIPANDDAVGSVRMLTSAIASAYLEGKESRKKDIEKEIEQQPKKKNEKVQNGAETDQKETQSDTKPKDKKQMKAKK